jgi:hypothetical protein
MSAKRGPLHWHPRTYYRYACPIDAACLDLLGIDADTVREVAHRVDGEVLIDRLAGVDRLHTGSSTSSV